MLNNSHKTVTKAVGNPSGYGVGNNHRMSKKALRKMRIRTNSKNQDSLTAIEKEKAELLASGLITKEDVEKMEADDE